MVVSEEVDRLLSQQILAMTEIRSMAEYYLLPEKPKAPPPGQQPNPVESTELLRKTANAHHAVELVCSLMNVFAVASGAANASGLSACSDLTFGLNVNPFWVQNASYLVPILNCSINALHDFRALRKEAEIKSLENKSNSLWSNLEYQCRNMWLEMLPAIMFCLKGYPAMREKSLEMKQAFEKFLRRN